MRPTVNDARKDLRVIVTSRAVDLLLDKRLVSNHVSDKDGKFCKHFLTILWLGGRSTIGLLTARPGSRMVKARTRAKSCA